MIFNWVDGLHAGSPPQKNPICQKLSQTWYPKQPVLNGCLVISNHFLYKDLVHHPTQTTMKQTETTTCRPNGNMAHGPTFTGGCNQLQTTLIPSYCYIEGTWWGNS